MSTKLHKGMAHPLEASVEHEQTSSSRVSGGGHGGQGRANFFDLLQFTGEGKQSGVCRGGGVFLGGMRTGCSCWTSGERHRTGGCGELVMAVGEKSGRRSTVELVASLRRDLSDG